MSEMHTILFWITVGCYVAASLFYIGWLIFGGQKGRQVERLFLFSGLIGNLALIVTRTIITQRLPVKNAYELNLIVALLALLLFLYMEKKYPSVRLAGALCIPFAFIALGLGITSAHDIAPLTPAYKSSWLVIHVIFALIATACFVFAAGASLLYLLKSRYQEDEMPQKYKNTPSLAVLDELALKLILIGFLADTVMLVSGSIWAKLLWGSFWSWDPVESWSLLSWLTYGIYIHLRVSFKYRGKLMAWFSIIGLIINLLSFWFIGLVTPETYHNLEQITNPWNEAQP